MTETQTAVNNKLAMSKALGAAFLNHQVEQLEKSVNRNNNSRNYRKDNRDAVSRSPGKSISAGKRSNGAGATDRSRRPPRDSVDSDRRTSNEKSPRRRSGDSEKDADIVIVDASVLIHGIHHLKRWCREGRQETVIVPLEALNTLDLLKKGLTPLGSRARGASRILEAQVGTNPRIRVQQDDAYVLWDNLEFKDIEDGAGNAKPSTSPEWVRRVICCARWELDHAKNDKSQKAGTNPKVVLAVCSNAGLSPKQSANSRLPEELLTPVPGPAPSNVHINKHEQRSNGSLVSQWAQRAGMSTLDLTPTIDHPGHRSSEDNDDSPKFNHRPRNKSRTYAWNRNNNNKGTSEEMVERPPAVAAMMEMVNQPTKVIKVLARGEKLDPDT